MSQEQTQEILSMARKYAVSDSDFVGYIFTRPDLLKFVEQLSLIFNSKEEVNG